MYKKCGFKKQSVILIGYTLKDYFQITWNENKHSRIGREGNELK